MDKHKKLRFDKGTTARALKKLEYLGFIERHRCKDDARANQVFLTSRGENVLPFVEKVLKELSSQIQEGLSPEERATAFYLISRMASNALLLKNDELSVLFNKE
jgi:DNA-binding MarR family transcriptional regulator